MQIQVGKAVLPLILLAALSSCQQTDEAAAAASGPVAETVAPKPVSMRATDSRITTGQTQNPSCNIERANGALFSPDQPSVTRSNTIEISGWIVDQASQSVPDNVKIRLQTANGLSAWEQDIAERVERVDVANNLHEQAYKDAGFKVNLDVPGLAPGDYVVYLAFDKAGSEVVCGIGRRLTLAP